MTNTFNRDIIDAPGVDYFSYAGASGPGEEDRLPPLFYLSYLLLLLREGRNDGWISVQSAKWGAFQREVPADHAQQSGGFLRRLLGRPVFDHLRFYQQIATDLGACSANR